MVDYLIGLVFMTSSLVMTIVLVTQQLAKCHGLASELATNHQDCNRVAQLLTITDTVASIMVALRLLYHVRRRNLHENGHIICLVLALHLSHALAAPDDMSSSLKLPRPTFNGDAAYWRLFKRQFRRFIMGNFPSLLPYVMGTAATVVVLTASDAATSIQDRIKTLNAILNPPPAASAAPAAASSATPPAGSTLETRSI